LDGKRIGRSKAKATLEENTFVQQTHFSYYYGYHSDSLLNTSSKVLFKIVSGVTSRAIMPE